MKWIRNRLWPTLLLSILLFSATAFLFGRLSDQAEEERLFDAQTRCRRAADEYYALEGCWPAEWDRIRTRTDLRVDADFRVVYTYYGRDLPPEIRVRRKGDAG